MKRMFFALAGLAAMMGTAAAADLPPRPAPAPYYKAMVPPPFSWTGFYVGINGGGGFGRSAWDSTGGFNTSGGLVGATAGYNYQIGQAVVGIEGDIDWANINGTTNTFCALGCKTSDHWLSTLPGRVGYAADRFMPFISGGLALGDIRAATPGFAGANTTNAGWTVGGGLEVALPGNWSAKAEYLHVDLGNFNCGTSFGPTDNNTVSMHD